MTKHLIIVGFTKCGTSLLNTVLQQTQEFVTPKTIKEINFFNSHWDDSLGLNWYYRQYGEPEEVLSPDKVLVDASPTYLHNAYCETLERIKLSLPDVKILICVRNPVYRAFSHYIHNINAHFSHRGFFFSQQATEFSKIYNYNFYEAFQQDTHIKEDYVDKIQQCLKIFGKDKVMLFRLEEDAKNFDPFYQRLCQFCGVEYQPYFKDQLLPKVLAGNTIANYLYSKDKTMLIPYQNKLFALEANNLFLVNSRQNRIFSNLSEGKILEILSASFNWTTFFHRATAQKMFEQNFLETSQQIADLIEGTDLSSWKVFKDKTIPPTSFSPKYCDRGKNYQLPEADYNLNSLQLLSSK